MPAPIVGAAAVAAARLIARKMAKDSAKKAVKKAVKTAKKSKSLAEPKSAIKVKLPAKTKGNPPDISKAGSKMIESVARAGGPKGPLGKARDARVFNSKNPTGNLRKTTAKKAK